MKQTRRYDIDWLRNIGILLLFPFHSARVFDYWDPFYVKSESLNWPLSFFIAGTSFWFMPLLFWLAGSSSWYALQFRSSRQYVKDRNSRLLIPLVFGLLLIVPPQGYFAKWAHHGESGNYFSFLKNYFLDFSDLSGYFGTFTPAHLWFILYLFVLSLVAFPLFIFLKNHHTTGKMERFHQFFSKPVVFLSFFLILAVTQVLPAPGGQNPFYFLVILIMGFITASYPTYQEMFNRIRFIALLALIILVPSWMMLIYHHQFDILTTLIRSLNTWFALIVILGYGNKYLNFSHKLLPYMNEAAFPVYIVHQSVLVMVGFFILKLRLGIYSEYLLIMGSTLVISLIMYEWIIKRTALTRGIFGVKIKPAKTMKNKDKMVIKT